MEISLKNLLLAFTLVATAAFAQDYPLKSERPKPTTATLVGVCENRAQVLMVAVFTYSDGHVLIVNGKQMQGFKDAGDIARYASTAEHITEMAQTCGDIAT